MKESNPTVRNLTYDSRDLLNYIDTLPDLGILTYPGMRVPVALVVLTAPSHLCLDSMPS